MYQFVLTKLAKIMHEKSNNKQLHIFDKIYASF